MIAASLQQHGASLHDAARQLRVSARSQQRHLAEMGTSYSEMAVRLCLGYAGPSSISRTFMRLMKIKPATYRRQRGRAAVLRDEHASVGSPH